MAHQMPESAAIPRTPSPWDSGTPSAWVLDATQSTFAFRVKHFWGLVTVQGHFTQVEGQATVDAAGAVAVSVRIHAASLDTKQQQRDKHLRSVDFFHVEQHPSVTFVSRQVTPVDVNRLRVQGDLTVAGRTLSLAFEARLSTSGERITVDADVPVDRRVFRMTWSPLGMAAATALLVVHAQFTQKS
jgi:polyisoprenoid-binding protein YceI